MDINTLTADELAAIEEIGQSNIYHANHLLTDKVIDPKSPNFGKKGESFYLKNGNQWYFKPKGGDRWIRMKWWQLETNVSDESYGRAKYIGINPAIYGKVGELAYSGKKWVFTYNGSDYYILNPDSVLLECLEQM